MAARSSEAPAAPHQTTIHTMKSTITLGLMMAALFLSTSTTAQVKEARFGHIDTQALLESMPERNTIQSEIEGAAAQYEQEIVRMQGCKIRVFSILACQLQSSAYITRCG